MASVFFYPAFSNREALCDQLFRMVWHFLPMVDRLESVVFAYAGDDRDAIQVDDILDSPQSDLSPDFDPAIADYAKRYIGRVKLGAPSEIGNDLGDLKGIIVWDTSEPAAVSEAQALAQKAEAEVVLVDPNLIQQETLEIIRFAYSLWPRKDLEALVEHSYASFLSHKKRWDGKSISVFGNGPSLGHVVKGSIEPETELRAVCNSTIGDQPALEHLKPELLFCGDPVQHCGVSLYAGDFRKGLVQALEDETRVLFTQLGYVPYFREITPSAYHDRIVGIGNDRRAEFNLDLTSEYLTAATANIFTMLVLPVAFTLSNFVDIYGCDGMPFKSATKPWSHAEEDDYMSKMSVTHRVHKGFWQRNYEEEYWAYSQDLVQILAAAEAKGCHVQVRTPSYVPALGARYKAL
jgi:hypothetical protein